MCTHTSTPIHVFIYPFENDSTPTHADSLTSQATNRTYPHICRAALLYDFTRSFAHLRTCSQMFANVLNYANICKSTTCVLSVSSLRNDFFVITMGIRTARCKSAPVNAPYCISTMSRSHFRSGFTYSPCTTSGQSACMNHDLKLDIPLAKTRISKQGIKSCIQSQALPVSQSGIQSYTPPIMFSAATALDLRSLTACVAHRTTTVLGPYGTQCALCAGQPLRQDLTLGVVYCAQSSHCAWCVPNRP